MINISKNKGMSLIELMIAGVIGIIVTGALLTLFDNFSNMSRTQNGLSRLQENGRYASLRLRRDIENVGFQPCATISMDSPQRIDEGFATRPFTAYTPMSNGLPDGLIDTQYFIQGHECDDNGTCTPSLGVSPGGDPYGKVPNVGTTANTRAKKTDVLTVRYLAADAVNVDDTGFPSTDSEFQLADAASAKPLELEGGDDVLVANCYNAMVLKVKSVSGKVVEIDRGSTSPLPSVSWASKESISSVFNFTDDFVTVTYYIGFKDHPDIAGRVISSLYRVQNGGAPQEIVEGVERFDLTYGVHFNTGNVAYLTAGEINSAATTDCITPSLTPSDTSFADGTNGTGCLWRSVFAIRVNMLLNTVYRSAPTNDQKYFYSPDGATAIDPATIPSGVNPDSMYRKEFSETISLQSYNL